MRIHAAPMVSLWWNIWSMTDFVHEWTGMLSLWNKADKAVTVHCLPSKAWKKFPILDECFLALNLLNNSRFIPVFREIAQRRMLCKVTWLAQVDWCSNCFVLKREQNIFCLVPKNKRSNWNTKIRSERVNQSLSLLVLQNMLDNLTWHRTQRLRSIHAVRCLLLMVCTCSECVEVAWNACFRGQTNQIWKTKEMEVKMNFLFTWIWMLPLLKFR